MLNRTRQKEASESDAMLSVESDGEVQLTPVEIRRASDNLMFGFGGSEMSENSARKDDKSLIEDAEQEWSYHSGESNFNMVKEYYIEEIKNIKQLVLKLEEDNTKLLLGNLSKNAAKPSKLIKKIFLEKLKGITTKQIMKQETKKEIVHERLLKFYERRFFRRIFGKFFSKNKISELLTKFQELSKNLNR